MRKGISDEKINYLCNMIGEYREKMSQNQSQIEELLTLIKENLQNDSSQDLINMIEQVKINNKITNENLLSYIEELKILQKNYKTQDERLSKGLDESLEKLKEE